MHGGPHSGIFVQHSRVATVPGHPDQAHTEHRLGYLVDGEVELHVQQPFRVPPGAMVVLPAGSPHRSLGGRDAEIWVAGFCGGCLGLDDAHPLMLPFRQVRYGALPVRVLPASRRQRVLGLFSALDEEGQRREPESLELQRSLIVLLLGELRRAEAAAPGPVANSVVAEALAFIHARALHPISLRDVARATGRSSTHLAGLVKAHTGATVGEWIRAVRVSHAATWLAHTDDSIAEIGQAVGWSDTTHFIRQFKKAYGITPAAWRRRERGPRVRSATPAT